MTKTNITRFTCERCGATAEVTANSACRNALAPHFEEAALPHEWYRVTLVVMSGDLCPKCHGHLVAAWAGADKEKTTR